MPTNERNPFADNENETNPFSGDLADDDIPSNPFATPLAGESAYDTQQAGHYETMSPGRGGTLMALGVTGLAIAVVGIIPFLFCLPVNVLGLAFSVSAWLMAKSDLRAIKLGAVDANAESATKTAHTMGLIGTALAGILPPALLLTLLLLDAGTQAMRSFFDSLGF